jgi:hypothetical protein
MAISFGVSPETVSTYNSHPKFSLATHNTLVASVEVTEERAELP